MLDSSLLTPAAVRQLPLPADLHDPRGVGSLRAALRRRGPGWVWGNLTEALRARWQLRACRPLPPWVRVQGKVRVHNEGSIRVGERVRFRAATAMCELVTWDGGRIEIGTGTTINYGTSISAADLVRIGRDCLVGTYVNIMDCTFHNMEEDHAWTLDAAPVIIGDRVWLGNRCLIMKGVTIGDGAVVAGCSLVTRDVPPRSLVVGVPARVVKNF